MSKEIIVNVDNYEDRVAVLEEGKLVELYIARGERMVGNIYKGKVANVLPGMQAAFIDIGLERNAFLCADDAVKRQQLDENIDIETKDISIRDIIKAKQEVLVQIIKEPIGTKGARVSNNLTIPGRFLVFLPSNNYIGISRRIYEEAERERLHNLLDGIKPPDAGLIARTASQHVDIDSIQNDLNFLVALWEKIQKKAQDAKAPAIVYQDLSLVFMIIRDILNTEIDRFIIDSPAEYEKVLQFCSAHAPLMKDKVSLYKGEKPIFDNFNIEGEIERALKRKIYLSSGGHINIDQTEALTVIDVNTGKYIGTYDLAETVLQTNKEAAVEIAHQLRLRDIGGIIIIDFIDMESEEHCNILLGLMENELKKDRTKTSILGMTSLGLVEMTRKRVSRDISTILHQKCPYCNGRGQILSLETVAIKIEREIRRLAINNKQEAILVICHPHVALTLAGWDGERIEQLEKQTNKIIYMRCDPRLHIEKYYLSFDSIKRIENKISTLTLGQIIELEIKEAHVNNLQSGIGLVGGCIIEVFNSGNMVGRKVKIKIERLTRAYAQAKLTTDFLERRRK